MGTYVGLVSQALVLLNKFVQQVMGRLHIIVSMFGVTIEKHQLLINYSQIGRRVYSRLHKEVRASRPAKESYSMDAVLKNFRRSFRLSTSLFQSLSLDPPMTMEELYKWVNRYSMMEDNIHAATQIVMIINQPTEGNKLPGKKPSKSKEGQSRDRKQSRDQSQKKRELPQFTPLKCLL